MRLTLPFDYKIRWHSKTESEKELLFPCSINRKRKMGVGKRKEKSPSRTAFSNHFNTPEAEPDWFGKGGGNLWFLPSVFFFFFSFVWFCKRYLPSVPLNADDLSVPCALLTSVSPPSYYRLVTARLVCTACPAYLDFFRLHSPLSTVSALLHAARVVRRGILHRTPRP